MHEAELTRIDHGTHRITDDFIPRSPAEGPASGPVQTNKTTATFDALHEELQTLVKMNEKAAPVQALASAMRQVREELQFLERSLETEENELAQLKQREHGAKSKLR